VSKKFHSEAPPKGRRKGLTGSLRADHLRFCIVVARFNEFITERLLLSALDALHRAGALDANIDVVRVPGSFEIPLAARQFAQTRKYDAIICLGCIIRGDTTHYEHIANEVTRGIGQSAQETGVPHAYGVLTCENLEQAIDRAGLKSGNKGYEAGLTAVEMANLHRRARKVQAAERRSAQHDDGRDRRERPRVSDLHRTVDRVLEKHGHTATPQPGAVAKKSENGKSFRRVRARSTSRRRGK
jgi:6,7-dimethyl-8-ribityllumazine synthase